MILPCESEADFHRMLADSQTRPVFLLKHSTRCPISAAAQAQYSRFAAAHADVECWQVLVIEQRAISNLVAEETDITHQSPQVMLLQGGKPVWSASHQSITEAALTIALESR